MMDGDVIYRRPEMGRGKWWSVACVCKRCGYPLVDCCPMFGDESVGPYECERCGLTGGYWADEHYPTREGVASLEDPDDAEGYSDWRRAVELLSCGNPVRRLAWDDGRWLFCDEGDVIGRHGEAFAAGHPPVYERYPLPACEIADARITPDDEAATDWYVPMWPAEGMDQGEE